MSARTIDTLVIGAGFDGAYAALSAAEQGRSVVVCDGGNGMSALWSGVFDIYGPTAPPPPRQLPVRFGRGASLGPAHTLDAASRLTAQRAVSPDAPAWGTTPAEALANFRAFIGKLGIEGVVHESPVLVPTSMGTVRYADFTAAGVAALSAGQRNTFVGWEAWPSWSPEWAADMAERALGAPQASAWVGGAAARGSSLGLAATAVDNARAALDAAAAAGADRVVTLPVLGLDDDARQAADAAAAERGMLLFELSAPTDSPFGLRAMKQVRARLDAATTRVAMPRSAPQRHGESWRVEIGDALYVTDDLRLHFDSPVPPVWAEPFLEAAARPPLNTAASPWLPQAFLRRVTERSEWG